MIKKILIFIINFLITISLFLVITCLILSQTLCNKNYIINKLNKYNYYDSVYDDIKQEFKQYIVQSGFDEEAIYGIYSKEIVTNDINSLINYLYEFDNLEISTEIIKNNLDEEIERQILEMNVHLDTQQQKEVDRFKDVLVDSYNNKIIYSKKYLDKAKSIYNKININTITIILSIISIILIVIEYLIVRSKYILNLLTRNLFSISIIGIIINIIIKNRISNILVINKYFSSFIINIISNILNNYIYISIILILLGIIMEVISIKNIKKNK